MIKFSLLKFYHHSLFWTLKSSNAFGGGVVLFTCTEHHKTHQVSLRENIKNPKHFSFSPPQDIPVQRRLLNTTISHWLKTSINSHMWGSEGGQGGRWIITSYISGL